MTTGYLTAEEEKELSRRWLDQGDESARNRLVEANQKFAWRMVRPFMVYGGVVPQDLFQEAMLALVKAASRFDYRADVRFSTYAAYWVTAYLVNYVYRMSGAVAIRQGKKNVLATSVAKKLRAKLEAVGLDASDEELDRRLGLEPGFVAQATAARSIPISLSTTSSEEERVSQLDRLAAPAADDPFEVTDRKKLIEVGMKYLNEREREIIKGRINEETLEVIGKRLKITRERVRQLENRAYNKMRMSIERHKETWGSK